MNPNLGRLSISRKTGDEDFHADGNPIGTKLLEFWRWSSSDLVSNVTRGALAEFVVATAIGIDTATVRDEWGAFDLQTNDGVKIEVKSSAFVQSWHQDKLTSISFRTPKTLTWDPDTNSRNEEPTRVADVYVFALLANKDKETIDPLDIDQWEFYVVPTHTLDQRTRSQHSITLKTLIRISGGAVEYKNLKQAVTDAYREQIR